MRSPKQDGLAITDRHHDGLSRRVRPDAERGDRDHDRRHDGGGDAGRALSPCSMAGGDPWAQRRVIREPGPGWEFRDGNDRCGDACEDVSDLLQIRKQSIDRDGGYPSELGHDRKDAEDESCAYQSRQDRNDQGVGQRCHRRNDMEIGGHHRESADLGGAGDRERLAQELWNESEAPFDGRGQQDDCGGTREGQLKTNVPGELGVPAEHRRACESERRPDVGGPAEPGRSDGKPTHRRGANGCGSRAADHRIGRDEAQRRPRGEAAEDRLERSLRDAGEDGNLQTAEDEQMHEAGRDQRVLQAGRDALPDPEHHAQQHGRVRRWHRVVERRGVVLSQPRGECRHAGPICENVEAGRLKFQVDLALREVSAAVESRQVSRQNKLAGRLDLLAETGDSWPAPANHQVADAGDLVASDYDLCGLDQDLAAASGWAGVVSDGTGDGRRVTNQAGGAEGSLRV